MPNMESSFEHVLPPRERLELTVNGMFAVVDTYDNAVTSSVPAIELSECGGCGSCEVCVHLAENPSTYETMLMQHNGAEALIIREVDSLGVSLGYLVGIRVSDQLSRGMAGLAWRPHDVQLPPRIFDGTRINTDDGEVTTALLSDWLKAHAERETAETMPPNPFNRIYESQEVTLGTLENEEMTEQELVTFLRLGIVATRLDDVYDTLRTLTEPILPSVSYILPPQIERPE